jgi:hypothetical protein
LELTTTLEINTIVTTSMNWSKGTSTGNQWLLASKQK